MDLVVDGEVQQQPLHGGRQDENAPRAPTSQAKARKQAGCKEEATGCLDAHHGNAETAHMLKMVSRPDLRNVLHCRQKSSHDAQYVGPNFQVVLGKRRQNARNENDSEAVEQGQRGYQQSCLPPRLVLLFTQLFVIGVVGGIISEEDEEQDEAMRLLTTGSHHAQQIKTYMKVKQIHCTPSCAIPSSPATQCNVSSSLQQATSCLDCGSSKMLAKADVAEVVPSRIKYGEMPSEVPREMIRKCWGR